MPGIFVRIPKSASRSIAYALHGKLDRHQTAKELRNHEEWNNSFKFAIVRDPYDRFVSGYHHAHYDLYKDINQFIADGDTETFKERHIQIFRPQYEFVYEGDTLMVDYLGRYEKLKESWDFICQRLGISMELPEPKTKIPEEKKMKLNQASKDFIYEYYKKDFELFGYKK